MVSKEGGMGLEEEDFNKGRLGKGIMSRYTI